MVLNSKHAGFSILHDVEKISEASKLCRFHVFLIHYSHMNTHLCKTVVNK